MSTKEMDSDGSIPESEQALENFTIQVDRKPAYSKAKLRRTFYVAVVGFFFIYGGFVMLMDLQSSINIESGLGSMAMLTMNSFGVFCCLFLTPVLVNFFGAKIGLVASDIGICIFTAANFYPKYYTMLPAAALNGMSFGALWVSVMTIISHVSQEMWNIKVSEGFDVGLKEILAGYFAKHFMFYSFGRLTFSGISYLVLYGARGLTSGEEDSIPGNYTIDENATKEEDWSMCVANDCQLEYVYNTTKEELSKFTPVKSSIYMLMGILLFLQLAATIAHLFLLPSIPRRFEKGKDEVRPAFFDSMKKTMINSFSHIISIQHLLVFPLRIYIGLTMGYVSSEFNRAYVSCTIGVGKIGLCMLTLGSFSLIMSTILNQGADKIGRVPIVLTALLLDIANFTTALLWTPTPSTSYVLYILAGMFGTSNTLLLNSLSNLTGMYFKDRVEVAYALQTVAITGGILIAFGSSVPLCVRTKIYILIPYFIFSVICWGISEIRFKRLSGLEGKKP